MSYQNDSSISVELFFERLMDGDLHTIIVFVLLAAFGFVVFKFISGWYKKGQPFFKFMFVLFLGFICYGLYKFPDKINNWFDKIVSTIETALAVIIPIF